MELFFFIILAIIFFGIFGDSKKQKSKLKASSILSPKNGSRSSQQSREDYPRDWKSYEDAERGQQSGMQDDVNYEAIYKLSKDRIGLARKAASEKLSDSLQSFDTTAKNTQTGGAHVAKQPPLVRDMNMSRKLFLSGGRGNTFGEREKKNFGVKTILGVMALAVTGIYLLGALSS